MVNDSLNLPIVKVIKATYGGRDCTEQVIRRIRGNSLVLRSNNDLIGDPAHGVVKILSVDIEEDNGNVVNLRAREGGLIVYPVTKTTRLGIFYSNNNTPSIYPIIDASLQSIEKAAKGKADILTCMWHPQQGNPFPEIIAWTQTSSHLNQLLQIMQLLYLADEMGEYEYVSFLEHDVLYPEGYFDYPDFPSNTIITNENFIGMNVDGYQKKLQADQPFHQMTMRFREAISHCESILSNALITNSGMIEPQNMTRGVWRCEHSAIHMNHGLHFTSHYNIYKKGGESTNNPYWGDHLKYKHLFKQ